MSRLTAALLGLLVVLAVAHAQEDPESPALLSTTGNMCLQYYPKVKAISGTNQFQTKPVKSYPDIKQPCPSGYHFATADSEIEIARNIIDAYFVQIVTPTCATKPTQPLCCKKGYFYPDGKEVGDLTLSLASVSTAPHHYSVTGCFANNMKKGSTYFGYGQGILNYYCGEDAKKTVKQVALIYAKGQFTAQ